LLNEITNTHKKNKLGREAQGKQRLCYYVAFPALCAPQQAAGRDQKALAKPLSAVGSKRLRDI
jgi:hypothetical protein